MSNLVQDDSSIFFQKILQILIEHISKTKNRSYQKTDFSFVSEHCASFGRLNNSDDSNNFEQPYLKN